MATGGKEARVIPRMLDALGVPSDGVLLVHSAFKDFHRDGYEASAVLDALIDYMKPGTLLLPTMSWRHVGPRNPVFDERATPSNTGILTEIFRTRPGVLRSLHPTHSLAGTGRIAGDLLGTHHRCVTPCAADSPFGKLAAANAHVVMMGIGMDCCTLIHHGEETLAPELYLQPPERTETYTCRNRTGDAVTVRLLRHRFLSRDFWQFQDALAAAGLLRVRRCDNAVCRGFAAADLDRIVRSTLTARPDAIITRPGQRYRLM